jgi:hypothetical protein
MNVRLAEAANVSFDTDLIAHIDRVGEHPFILVRMRNRNAADNLLVCQTQNEAADFIQTLGILPRYQRSRLLRALVCSLQGNIYDAGELLFSWTMNTAGILSENVLTGLPDGQQRPWFYRYPAFDIADTASEPATTEQRIAMLAAAFDAYDATDGNDRLRHFILEGLALGLCRALGTLGRFQEARGFVVRTLAYATKSMHLKAALYAVELRLAGREVPPRLIKFIGRDNGYLKRFVCPHPFENFEINHTGEVLTCAGPWISTGIGNFLSDSVDAAINSAKAKAVRKSVVDGTYKFCNHLECARMIQGTLPRREEIERTSLGAAMARPDHGVESVKELVFAFDKTCNLSCPSCRGGLIAEKAATTNAKIRAVEEKLPPLLPEIRAVQINASGELFASKSSRRVLELIDDERCPNLGIDIISNGTLFSEREWNKFPGIHNKIRSVRISTDAACEATFVKLRRGAKYQTFLENLRFLSGLRVRGIIPQLALSFTYQVDNFREMVDFLAFRDEMKADYVMFERLLNLVFTDHEYRQKAVHRTQHPLYEEFIAIIRQQAFCTWQVWHDFDYPGVKKLDAREARHRFEWAKDPWSKPRSAAQAA